jgi:leucyl-tRNA synthetase
MILAENGEKMSKSQGNVINPDEVVEEYGADTLRMFEMFIGDFEKSVPWSENGVKGCKRFLDRVYRMLPMINDEDGYSKDMEIAMHKTVMKVGEDFETLKFNTGIAALMTLANDFYHKGEITAGEFKTFLILLNPVAPHITEELWQIRGHEGMLNQSRWPSYDEDKTVEDKIEIVVQINGKVRHRMMVSSDLDRDGMKEKVMFDDEVVGLIGDKKVVKVIPIPGRLVNIVVK